METQRYVFNQSSGQRERVSFGDIPFYVSSQNGLVQPLPYTESPAADWPSKGILIGAACRALFFLGMVTEKPECSEWWGLSERYHYHGKRLFIGDRVGTIAILYADQTQETIPVLFGVNVWPYELLNPLQPQEVGKLNNYWGPYPEPFASDAQARELRDQSLVMMENPAEKGMKYIFGVLVKPKVIQAVALQKTEYKEAGFVVSAVTGLLAGEELNPDWRIVAPDFFLKKAYFPAMDRLARRLYQFNDDLPAHDPVQIPDHFSGPSVRFAGNGIADIFTNVYAWNLHDMATRKVDETGKSHTSSGNQAYFGCYIGMGTFAAPHQAYYAHMWSRDVGRELVELLLAGEADRTLLAGDVQAKYLYDGCVKYHQPHWKRISNGMELGDANLINSLAGKENDGHAAIMLFFGMLFKRGVVDAAWLKAHQQVLHDAAGWITWQIENPELSNFDRVLYSESEAATQAYGGYDLFSNAQVVYALRSFEALAQAIEDKPLAEECKKDADLLWQGIFERFTGEHPRFGQILTDTTDDCWTWEYKRFAPLFLFADTDSYDPFRADPDLYALCRRTYQAQKEEAFSTASGRQMGYGQGYLTETAILLDEYEDLTACVEWAAKFCYHHRDYPYIVPEGVIMHPSGRFWFRNSDLGNAVQQGEIVKCARLLIGLDDLDPETGLGIIPRLPNTWERIEVKEYTVMVQGRQRASVEMIYQRTPGGYTLSLKSSQPVKVAWARLGPFPQGSQISITGEDHWKRLEIGGHGFAYVSIERELVDLELGGVRVD